MMFRRVILLDFGTCSSEQQNWKEKYCQYIDLLKFITGILLKFYSYMFIEAQIRKQTSLPLVGYLGHDEVNCNFFSSIKSKVKNLSFLFLIVLKSTI